MAMPNDLVFVRHGQSEANVIQKADKSGVQHESHEIVSERPDWEQRLTDAGIEQAWQAKQWFDYNLGGAASFDLRYFSPFLRTRETAAYLGGVECGDWIVDDRVTERSWGIFGLLPKAERAERFELTSKLFERSPWYTAPEGGESRYEVSDRFRDFQGTLHREAAGKRVLVVTHGDFMGIARYNIERMLPETFEEMESDPSQTMKNCTILHYSRCNPDDPADVCAKLNWRKIIYPTDIANSPYGGQWVRLGDRPTYTGTDLLQQVERASRLVPGV